MAEIKILIVENDSSFASSLKISLQKWQRVEVSLFKSVDRARDFLKRTSIDLIITRPTLDQEGDGVKFGLDVANGTIPLIYIANPGESNFYDQVKRKNLLSFFVRPFDFTNLIAALDLYFSSTEHFLIFPKGRNKLRIKHTRIFWIKSAGNYCMIKTAEKEYRVKQTLKSISDALPSKGFVQIHRAFIIQIDKISDINVKNNLVNILEEQLPIGRKFKKDFLDRINVL